MSDRTPGQITKPMQDIRVLDFSHAAAGPFATQSLADLGADVIKIEKPGRGDGARYMGIPMHGRSKSDYFLGINRNKRSVLIDLSSADGIELARRLAATSDVVMQNFRPGVMERLGLGFDDLSPLREGLVYCSISAFGSDGPWRDRPGNDVVLQSVSGFMGVTGELDGGPVKVGAPICDYVSGLFGLVGVLAALRNRDAHPEGQHVEISMLEASIAMMSNYIPNVVDLGGTIPRLGRAHAQLVPYQAFLCSDGEYVMVGAFTNAFWERLCDCIGCPELFNDPRFLTNGSRLKHRDVLLPVLEARFAEESREYWLAALDRADVPNSPVYELNEALDSAPIRARQALSVTTDGQNHATTAGFPVRSQQWDRPGTQLAPSMGQHTEEVLKSELDMTDTALHDLIERGVIRFCEEDQ